MSNRRILLQAAAYTMLTFASIHLFVSMGLMLFKDIQDGSLFRIISLHRIWPNLDDTLQYFLLSQLIWIAVLGVYVAYLLKKNHSKQPNKKV